jgi:hypothetical protein
MAAKRRSGGPSSRAPRGQGRSTQDGGEFQARPGVKTALIRGNSFAAKAVQYVEVEGLALFEGDIVLGTADEVAHTSDQLRAEMGGGVAAGVILTGAQFRWPNCRVPYTIDPALPNQARVIDAIAHWEAHTRFRFVVRTTEADYVTFRPSSGCSSSVGRRGGQQFVNLASGCSLGNTIHEIGHAVGLWHEQSREDRDMFIAINWAKIQPGTEHNFNQHITDGDDVGAYDFGSIMHYPRNAFSIDGTDTITPIAPVPPGVTIGQRSGLSPGDIAAANSMCPAKLLKEGPKDPIKEVRKEVLKEIPRDTVKEQIKDIRLDTRKELIRDTIKEGVLDPGPITIAENVITPRLPQPGPLQPVPGGALPFAVATPHTAGAPAEGAAGLQANIEQLDAQLQQLADQLAQAESARQSLQEQYNETAALLAQLIQEHDQSAR